MLIFFTLFKFVVFFMAKTYILVVVFFISFAVNSSGEVLCQFNLICDNDSGACNTPSGWVLDTSGATENFVGKDTVYLSNIIADKGEFRSYRLSCHYSYGKHSGFWISTIAKELTGDNWVFSGFNKKRAVCSDVTNPTACAGIVY